MIVKFNLRYGNLLALVSATQGLVSFLIGLQDSNIYLRYRNGLLYAEAYDHSSSFANSACFYIRHNKWFPRHAAIESVYSPGYYLRHEYLQLKHRQYSSTALFEKDASYRILEPKCQNFQSHNVANYYFGFSGRDAYISSTLELWIPVRPGQYPFVHIITLESTYATPTIYSTAITL